MARWRTAGFIRYMKIPFTLDGPVDDESEPPHRYLSDMLCLPSLAHYEEDIENGIVPSGIQVLEQDGAGIDPYSFLDLP